MTENKGALADIRVIELGQLIAGPFCGQLLGDMGADVIKVEPPGAGDPMREWGHGDAKLWWEVVARNKRSVSANLRVPEGQEIVRRLVAHADILIENFKPGTLEKWGLGPDALHAINPRLIIVRVSGYGQTGPYSSRAGFGGIGEAMGGWRAIVGDPDRPPSRMGVSIGDSLAASYACMGALAALHARERTGRGQVVDSALYEAVLQVMESLVPEYVVSGHVRRRSGSVLEAIAPSNVYPCCDGDYLIGANQDAVFARLCAAMGEPDLASDPRYATHRARGERQVELDERIAAWTATLTVDALERLMIEHSVPAGRIYGAKDMLADPHFAAREALVEVQSPRWGAFQMQNAFPKMSDTPGSIRTLAPAIVGQDNDAIYGDLLGLDAAERERLKAAGGDLMEPFTILTSTAAPLPEDNVDTDIILPARFLLHTEKQGLGRFAFYERRYDADGVPKPDFPLNDPRYDGARILVAGANFGCGSSREHAPWALADLGFRAILAPSFGEIFAGNCVKNGMVPVVVPAIAPFFADAAAARPITVDLERRLVERTDGGVTPFAIDDWAREALLNGWGEIETILGRHGGDITIFEAGQRAAQPWLWSNER